MGGADKSGGDISFVNTHFMSVKGFGLCFDYTSNARTVNRFSSRTVNQAFYLANGKQDAREDP